MHEEDHGAFVPGVAVQKAGLVAVTWYDTRSLRRGEAGCRFVERLLAVVQTRRLQGLPVLDYLYEALLAHRADLPAPQLRSAN